MDEGDKIISRFPENSPIHDPSNPGHIMIKKAIGVEFESIFADLIVNCDARFLKNATGKYLDYFGDWFGIPRQGKTDEEYRSVITSLRTSDITIKGLKSVISLITGISTDEITIINADQDCFKYNSSKLPDHYGGSTLNYAAHYTKDHGVMTIQVPTGTDISFIQSFIDNIVLPGVTVWFEYK